MHLVKISIVLLLALSISACESSPKVIESESSADESNAPIFQEAPIVDGAAATATPPAQEEHQVVVEEVMNTDRYSYLRVKENGQEFWIAIAKRDVKIGNTYFYKGGLLKKNFQSQEFNRLFETLYLVSDFRDQAGAAQVNTQVAPSTETPANITPAAGAIKIADLVANLSKYEGKLVKVTGKCVKINPMIMGRNWVHIQDGSGKNIDLTITTTENIQVGSVITLEGTLALNKDFGAGYKYDYIVESAVIK